MARRGSLPACQLTGNYPLVGEIVRRERHWPSAGATPTRELVRSTEYLKGRQVLTSAISLSSFRAPQRKSRPNIGRQEGYICRETFQQYFGAQATACEVVSPLRDLIALASSLSISNTADNLVIWSRSFTRLFRFTSLSCPP